MTTAPATHYTRIAQLRTAEALAARLEALGIELPFDPELETGAGAALAKTYTVHGRIIGNRFAILPMEGWDGTADGQPTELTRRRWQRFGASGAKLIWGGEAVAVRPDGRANPQQLMINAHTLGGLADLRQALIDTHRQAHGDTSQLYLGLQLTHSGRFARPTRKDRLEPLILYAHPRLNPKFGLALDHPTFTDTQIDDLIGDFVRAACQAAELGFDFVDVKHCHGYLGHEFLSAVDRPGRYGGSFENRTRFLREIVAGIRRDAPGLAVGVRLSAFDGVPFKPGPNQTGIPEEVGGHYPYAFGADPADPRAFDLGEVADFLRLLESLEVRLVCVTAGSPYYNPHVQRPALFPPSDGYQPPEDPLVGVARQMAVTAELKAMFPNLAMVGSAYSYLQEWLPHVAQHNVRTGRADFAGLGRMVLAYPDLPSDVLAGRPLKHKLLCRTFSDCTTGPRSGLISGCFPLDPYYKSHPEHALLKAAKLRLAGKA